MLNLIILIILCIWIIYIYNSKNINYRLFKDPLNENRKYIMSKEMYFLIFTTCTAPLFLGSFSLIKYGVWFMTLVLLVLTNRIKLKFEMITISYLIFFFWILISLSYSTHLYEGFMLLIKYTIPLLFLWLGYNAISDKYSFYYYLEKTNIAFVIYVLLIGGVSAKFMPWLYHSELGATCLKYAGFADFLTAVTVIPVVLYWRTKKIKYILCVFWFILSTVLEVVRTGLGGIFLVLSFSSLFYYKIKSIPYIFTAVILFISAILFIPDVNEKMFGEKAGKVTTEDIVYNNALSIDNIETTGRSVMWDIALNKLYEPNKITGSGLGEVMWLIKDFNSRGELPALLHSDYVQILCDSGLIGLILLIVFYISIIIKVLRYVVLRNSSIWTVLSGIMAVSSMAGIAFSMGFDNVVSHSMTSLIFPFIFIGFFLKFIDLEKASA